MKRAWNIIWKIALAMGAVGIVLTLIGLKLGWPQPVAWGPHGPKVMEVSDVSVTENNLTPFDTIAMDVGILDIQVVTGDHYGLQISADTTYMTITWSNDNGTLKVSQTGNNPYILNFGFNSVQEAVVTVPSGVTLKRVDISNGAGNVTLGVPAGTVSLYSAVGDVKLTAPADKATVRTNTGNAGVEADVPSLTATSSTGDVRVSGSFDTVQANTSTGSVTVTGSATNVDATSSIGDVRVTLSTPWATTTYTVHTSVGDIRFAGPGAPPSDNRSGQASSPQLTLTATTSTGDVYVTLGV